MGPPKSVDLTKRMITHMNKELTSGIDDADHLLLDQNSISKFENLLHLTRLTQLSAAHNCLIKIAGLQTLKQLTVLNLSENSICSIEGLSTLTQLVWLNLSGNNIQTITGLEYNTSLKHLDLSDNTISQLSNISFLTNLKSLLLHGNIIRDLKSSSNYLPDHINILSLAENEINNLTQVENLSCFNKLEQLSLMNNPCVKSNSHTHHVMNYRSYVLSYCSSLSVLDAQQITKTERSHAEMLACEPNLRSIKEQSKLISYLGPLNLSMGRRLPNPYSSNNAPQHGSQLEKKREEKILNDDVQINIESVQSVVPLRTNSESGEITQQNDHSVKTSSIEYKQKFYTNTHHYAALTIQTRWRGYAVRNLNPTILSLKQEIRARRLEDAVGFLISEMTRQQKISKDGQKLRGMLITGVKSLNKQVTDLQSMFYTDPSAV